MLKYRTTPSRRTPLALLQINEESDQYSKTTHTFALTFFCDIMN